MPTSRRKSSGFSAPKEEETASVEALLEEIAEESFETISQMEKQPEAKPEVAEATPFIPMEIVPTEDAGPRFVEETVTLPPQAPAPAATPQLQPPPKRHPRNTPKFSRHK